MRGDVLQGPQHAGVPLWPCLCRDCLIQRCLLKHSAASTFGQFYKGWVIRVEGDDNFDFSLNYHCIIIENPTENSKWDCKSEIHLTKPQPSEIQVPVLSTFKYLVILLQLWRRTELQKQCLCFGVGAATRLAARFPHMMKQAVLWTSPCEVKCQQIRIKNICRWLHYGLQAIIQYFICLSLWSQRAEPARGSPCEARALGSSVFLYHQSTQQAVTGLCLWHQLLQSVVLEIRWLMVVFSWP